MTEQQQRPLQVFSAIENVMADIAKAGVGKNAMNTQQNFKYQAADDVMDTLAPILSKHHLIILPSVESHALTERMTANQRPVLHALLKLTYTFLCPLDGSSTQVGPIYGEAMDSGDKATNKAMTAAYKYLCKYSFCIPITGDDPDSQSHEIAGTPKEQAQRPGPRPESPSETAPPARSSASPAPSGEMPVNRRPGGMFGFGKKHKDTPWNVVPTDYLEWALNADRMPQDVRARIAAELEWRDYEKARMERVDEETREKLEAPLDDEIPWS